ncbi:MAG: uridine kinase [Clostridia bacterium]|nr:uridine kinase [Clostridia bacterium]
MNGTEALAARIAAIRDEGRRPVIVAIDGPCAGGKTTLAARLGVMLDAQVYHMDDFFLQAHQRTAQRFAVPGENVDHERFLEEVLLPLREGRAVVYRPFDCGRMAIGGPVPVRNTPVCIVEGSYSLHESLAGLYDLRVLLQVDPQTQRSRILRRNGEEGLRAFEARWIPLENSYFEATDIASRCDVILEPDEAEL